MRHEIVLRPSRDGRQVLAFCPDLPGCSAAAPNEVQALVVLKQRLEQLGFSPEPVTTARDIPSTNRT